MQCTEGRNEDSSFDSAMVVVGLGHVSSVQFDVDIGDRVNKGQRMGHFAYGGSTMILLFPHGVIDSAVPAVGTKLKMGEPLARTRMEEGTFEESTSHCFNSGDPMT